MRISDWSSDVCSSDRRGGVEVVHAAAVGGRNVEVVVRATARNRVEGIDAVDEVGVDEVAGGVHRKVVVAERAGAGDTAPREIGRASGRVRVCQYVSI